MRATKKEKVVKIASSNKILKPIKDKARKKMGRLRRVHRLVSKDLLLVQTLIKIKYNLRTTSIIIKWCSMSMMIVTCSISNQLVVLPQSCQTRPIPHLHHRRIQNKHLLILLFRNLLRQYRCNHHLQVCSVSRIAYSIRTPQFSNQPQW